jgi:hypothetical protein
VRRVPGGARRARCPLLTAVEFSKPSAVKFTLQALALCVASTSLDSNVRRLATRVRARRALSDPVEVPYTVPETIAILPLAFSVASSNRVVGSRVLCALATLAGRVACARHRACGTCTKNGFKAPSPG